MIDWVYVMEIYFTKHADEKFAVLARHGVNISRNRVLLAVQNPDLIDRSRLPLLIAQYSLNKKPCLMSCIQDRAKDYKNCYILSRQKITI